MSCPTSKIRGVAKRRYPVSEVRGSKKRSYPTSKVRGSGWEEIPHTFKPEARGGGREDQPHAVAARAQGGLESYSTFKVRRGSGEEIPLIQGKEQQLRFAGAAVKRYPTPKVRETQVRW